MYLSIKMYYLSKLICFVVFALLCFEKDCTHAQSTEGCSDHEVYNVCEDPVNLGTFMSPENARQCDNYIRPFIREARLVTQDLIRLHTRPIIEFFSHEHNVSEDELMNRNLLSLFQQSTNTLLFTLNPATSTYMKLSKLVNVYKLLHCQLTDTLRRCHCLKFPDYLFQRIKSRLLGKLYLIQDKCGQYIEQQQCDITLSLPFDLPITCETLRDVIYNFLRHVLDSLLETDDNYSAIRLLTR